MLLVLSNPIRIMKTYLFLFSCLLGVLSCRSSTDSNATQDVIMPLAIGNTWIYHTGRGTDIIKIPTDDTIRLVSKFSYAGNTTFVNQYGAYYTNRSDGLWITYPAFSYEILSANYPANQGNIFRRDTLILTDESSPDPIGIAISNVFVDSIGEIVTVPAGTYPCYKYNSDIRDTNTNQILTRINTFYSVNFGLIKMESYMLDTISQTLKLQESSKLTKIVLN